MPRMRILSPSERDDFDKPPVFDFRDRKKFLTFPQSLLGIAQSMRNPAHRIGFLVNCGYFRATRRFFAPSDFVERDLVFVARGLGLDPVSTIEIQNRTRQRHQGLILDHYGFSPFAADAAAMLAGEIATMARMHLKPRLMVDRCLDILTQRRVQVPGSGRLIALIRSALQRRAQDLARRVETNLTDAMRTLLDDLFATPGDQNRYRLTLLKTLPQSTKPARIREAVQDFEAVSRLHDQLSDLLRALDLNPSGIRFFAGSVLRSEMFQIQRRTDSDRYLHATAFIAHQFSRYQDTLIDLWLQVMASYQSRAKRDHADSVLENRKARHQQIRDIVDDWSNSRAMIQGIRSIVKDGALSDTQKVAAIGSLLEGERGTDGHEALIADLDAADAGQDWYAILEKKSQSLQNRLSPILRSLTFDHGDRAAPLGAAMDHFKAMDGAVGPKPPVAFLSAEERAALHDTNGRFRVSLYKVLLFQHITAAIKSGDLNLEHSNKYCPMDSYMISRERWKAKRPELLAQAGLEDFADPKTVLATLSTALEEQYRHTNTHLKDNPYLKLNADGSFFVKTPGVTPEDAEGMDSLFPRQRDVPLAQVLKTVNTHCGMLDAFEHWRQTRGQGAAPHPVLLAGIMGLGCGIGVRRMARISSRVTENALEYAVNWRFSLENIRAANDIVVKAMDRMDLPNLYRRNPSALHTASDGQKFEVYGDSLLARYSFKYFGQHQGISTYLFVDERHLLWHSLVISAADRESIYVIDGLMQNDVVKSDIHSTDTHGYTEAVFGLTHMLGFSFAPRIKGIGKLTRYGFGSPRAADKSWAIRPDKAVNEALICANWDEFLRMAVTIKLKENTASAIFRRLNSHSRQHALYQTVKAFGQIIKTLFIL
ncbi:MAG: Tn3 family transposase, partial [Rhodobacter sp.]|nr:Tn3 family transposase [Rhodobacter sp.]